MTQDHRKVSAEIAQGILLDDPQGAVLHEGEADLAPPRPTLSFTKQALRG